MAKMRTQINSLMPRSIDYLCAVCKSLNTLNKPPGQQTLCQHSDCERLLGLEVKNDFYFLLQGAGDGNYGNSGHVYKAQKLGDTENFYAVKIFHQNLNQNSLEKSLNREIKCLKNLNDKGVRVPKYIDHLCPSQITEATPYVVVLEYVDGKNLEKCIQERQRNVTNGNILFKEKEIFDFFIDLLETLYLIHQKGETIHRDIKPANIVKQKETNKLYLVDFGSAKVLELVDNYQTEVAFTRAYATPELFLRRKNESMITSTGLNTFINDDKYKYTHDLYSVALTICDLITAGEIPKNCNYDRESPFYNEFWEAWMSEVCTKAPKLGIILKRMLSFYPPHRYHSALEVLLIVRAIAWKAWGEDKWLIGDQQWLRDVKRKFQTAQKEPQYTDDFLANILIKDFLEKSEECRRKENVKILLDKYRD